MHTYVPALRYRAPWLAGPRPYDRTRTENHLYKALFPVHPLKSGNLFEIFMDHAHAFLIISVNNFEYFWSLKPPKRRVLRELRLSRNILIAFYFSIRSFTTSWTSSRLSADDYVFLLKLVFLDLLQYIVSIKENQTQTASNLKNELSGVFPQKLINLFKDLGQRRQIMAGGLRQEGSCDGLRRLKWNIPFEK